MQQQMQQRLVSSRLDDIFQSPRMRFPPSTQSSSLQMSPRSNFLQAGSSQLSRHCKRLHPQLNSLQELQRRSPRLPQLHSFNRLPSPSISTRLLLLQLLRRLHLQPQPTPRTRQLLIPTSRPSSTPSKPSQSIWLAWPWSSHSTGTANSSSTIPKRTSGLRKWTSATVNFSSTCRQDLLALSCHSPGDERFLMPFMGWAIQEWRGHANLSAAASSGPTSAMKHQNGLENVYPASNQKSSAMWFLQLVNFGFHKRGSSILTWI